MFTANIYTPLDRGMVLLHVAGGIKISAVCSFVSSQSTHVTNGQNYDPQDRASIATSRGNKSEK